jgi:hypothetical protein
LSARVPYPETGWTAEFFISHGVLRFVSPAVRLPARAWLLGFSRKETVMFKFNVGTEDRPRFCVIAISAIIAVTRDHGGSTLRATCGDFPLSEEQADSLVEQFNGRRS